MGMKECGRTDRMYFSSVQLRRGVFAEETEKCILARAIAETKQEECFRVYAFSMLDNALFLLTGAEDATVLTARKQVQEIMRKYMALTQSCCLTDEGLKDSAETWIAATPVRGRKDAMDVIRYIHLLPANRNYAGSGFDYWWTSLSTYRGRYAWDFVDIAPVLQQLDERDENHARNLIVRQHRKAEKAGNPVPECLRAGA